MSLSVQRVYLVSLVGQKAWDAHAADLCYSVSGPYGGQAGTHGQRTPPSITWQQRGSGLNQDPKVYTDSPLRQGTPRS